MTTTGTREDKLFSRLPSDIIIRIREAKQYGYSLSDIANTFHIAKSTASLYCRDLFWYPNRIYGAEQEMRDAIAERGKGKVHSIYHPCIDCGETIRNERARCLKCLLIYQRLNGELESLIKLGEAYRFQEKEFLKRKIPKTINQHNRKHNYKTITEAHTTTGYGAYRLSKLLNIPRSTLSDILTKTKRNQSLIGEY